MPTKVQMPTSSDVMLHVSLTHKTLVVIACQANVQQIFNDRSVLKTKHNRVIGHAYVERKDSPVGYKVYFSVKQIFLHRY